MAVSNTVARPTKKKNYNNMAYVFVLPFVVVFLIFSVYPVFRTLQLSFANYKGFGDVDYIGFKNYLRFRINIFGQRSKIQ